MTTKIHHILVCAALALTAFSTCNLQPATAFAQGTAFTYQGQLTSSGNPANGSYDFKLFLYDATTAGNVLAGPVTNTAVAVSNGLFTMTVDFGPGVFVGGSNWLHLAVCTNGAGNFVALSPRQQLTPAPYSIFAESVSAGGINGTIPAGNVGGAYSNTVNFNNGANSFDGSFYGDFYGATFTGGYFNQIQSWPNPNAITANTIAGGYQNFMPGTLLDATIGGGVLNTNAGWFSTIPGGYENYTAGNYSFAAGNHAQALYQGDFVWADSQNTNFAATTTDQVSFRCQGGVRFTSGSGALNQTVAWTPGSGSWSFPSDRNLRDRYESVDTASVLDKVSQLPIVEWSYKGYAQRHIGAMAQDFHALFPLNNDDKSLNDADLHGVELAAIQGLNQKVETKDVEIRQLKQQNESLEKRLENLE